MKYAIVNFQGWGFDKDEIIKIIREEVVDGIDISVCRYLEETETDILVPSKFLDIIEVKDFPKYEFNIGEEVFFTRMKDDTIPAGSKVIIKHIHVFEERDGSLTPTYTVSLLNSGIEKKVQEFTLLRPNSLMNKILIPLDEIQVISDNHGNRYVVVDE